MHSVNPQSETRPRSGTFAYPLTDSASSVSVVVLNEEIALATTGSDGEALLFRRADDVDCVLVGADTVLPDGRVVNKTGTRGAVVAADRAGVPVYVVAASDKISTEPTPRLESGPPDAVYGGPAGIEAVNPTFDVTPAACVDALLTERGALSRGDLGTVVSEFRELERW